MSGQDLIITLEQIPNVHGVITSAEHLNKIFEDYKQNKFYVSDGYTIVKLEDTQLWSTEIHDRSWLFWHHCLVSVAFLIDSYKVDRNKEKLDLAYEITKKWYMSNYPSSPSVMGWHDHSTALRLIHIIKLYIVLAEINSQDERLFSLNYYAEKHMIKLADPKFYMEKHNHGLDQDIALYIASLVFHTLRKSSEWKKLSYQRFLKQVDDLFAEDGSYLEHSPHYIYLILERLLQFYRTIGSINEKSGEYLKERIEKIVSFFIYTIQPDGKFPTIGDSEARGFKIDDNNWGTVSKNKLELIRAITNKQEIKDVDLDLDSFYPEGGYAFFRSSWDHWRKTTQVIFYSSFHSRVHKHHDDLAFTLYGHGMPLLIDAGKYSYQYDRPERQYVVSSYGHNTVRLNEEETNLARLNINKSGLFSYRTMKNIGYASGFHMLTKNVRHRRILFYLKPNDLLILDMIDGHKETSGELIFNLHPSLDSKVNKGRVVSTQNEKPLLYFDNLLDDHSFQKFRGEQSPLLGWSSATYRQFVANDLILMKKKGTNIRFATLIRLDNNHAINNFEWINNHLSFNWKSNHVKVKLTDLYEEMMINKKVYTTKKVPVNVKLLEELKRLSL